MLITVEATLERIANAKSVRIHNGTIWSRLFPRRFSDGGAARECLSEIIQTEEGKLNYFPWTCWSEERARKGKVEVWRVNPNSKPDAEVERYVISYHL